MYRLELEISSHKIEEKAEPIYYINKSNQKFVYLTIAEHELILRNKDDGGVYNNNYPIVLKYNEDLEMISTSDVKIKFKELECDNSISFTLKELFRFSDFKWQLEDLINKEGDVKLHSPIPPEIEELITVLEDKAFKYMVDYALTQSDEVLFDRLISEHSETFEKLFN